jgi:hypothetical protein
MVAFNCSRRHRKSIPPVAEEPLDALTHCGNLPLDSVLHAAASHRTVGSVELRKRGEQIQEIRIGRWRVIAAGPTRRLAEVRELGCERVAVRIERLADNGIIPSSEIWQLYRFVGRLEAALQTTPDGKFALLTNYRTRQACRMVANSQGELQPVEVWNI